MRHFRDGRATRFCEWCPGTASDRRSRSGRASFRRESNPAAAPARPAMHGRQGWTSETPAFPAYQHSRDWSSSRIANTKTALSPETESAAVPDNFPQFSTDFLRGCHGLSIFQSRLSNRKDRRSFPIPQRFRSPEWNRRCARPLSPEVFSSPAARFFHWEHTPQSQQNHHLQRPSHFPSSAAARQARRCNVCRKDIELRTRRRQNCAAVNRPDPATRN